MEIIDYLKFRLKSVNAHGLHSPFMYQLATQCFYDKKTYPNYKKLKKYCQSENLQNISKLTNTKEIIRKKQITHKKIKAFYRLSQYFKPKKIIEWGNSLGCFTYALKLGNPKAEIINVIDDKNNSNIAVEFASKKIDVNFVTPDIFFSNINNNTSQTFDMILIDDDINLKMSVSELFEKLKKHIHNDTVVIVNNVHRLEKTQKEWKKIIESQFVRQSVNCFYFGLIFFRKNQFKQNFNIRL